MRYQSNPLSMVVVAVRRALIPPIYLLCVLQSGRFVYFVRGTGQNRHGVPVSLSGSIILCLRRVLYGWEGVCSYLLLVLTMGWGVYGVCMIMRMRRDDCSCERERERRGEEMVWIVLFVYIVVNVKAPNSLF